MSSTVQIMTTETAIAVEIITATVISSYRNRNRNKTITVIATTVVIATTAEIVVGCTGSSCAMAIGIDSRGP